VPGLTSGPASPTGSTSAAGVLVPSGGFPPTLSGVGTGYLSPSPSSRRQLESGLARPRSAPDRVLGRGPRPRAALRTVVALIHHRRHGEERARGSQGRAKAARPPPANLAAPIAAHENWLTGQMLACIARRVNGDRRAAVRRAPGACWRGPDRRVRGKGRRAEVAFARRVGQPEERAGVGRARPMPSRPRQDRPRLADIARRGVGGGGGGGAQDPGGHDLAAGSHMPLVPRRGRTADYEAHPPTPPPPSTGRSWRSPTTRSRTMDGWWYGPVPVTSRPRAHPSRPDRRGPIAATRPLRDDSKTPSLGTVHTGQADA